MNNEKKLFTSTSLPRRRNPPWCDWPAFRSTVDKALPWPCVLCSQHFSSNLEEKRAVMAFFFAERPSLWKRCRNCRLTAFIVFVGAEFVHWVDRITHCSIKVRPLAWTQTSCCEWLNTGYKLRPRLWKHFSESISQNIFQPLSFRTSWFLRQGVLATYYVQQRTLVFL